MELALAASQVAGMCDSVGPDVCTVLFMDGNTRGRLSAVHIRDPMRPGLCGALNVKIEERDPEILGWATRTSRFRRQVSVPHGTWVAIIVTGAQGDELLIKPARTEPWRKVDPRRAPFFALQSADTLRRSLDGEALRSIQRRFVSRSYPDWSGWYVV